MGHHYSQSQYGKPEKRQQHSRRKRSRKARPVYNTGNPLGSTSMNLVPNISAALSYAGWWLTGLFFLIRERHNRFVRFHALQSIIVFLILSIVWALLRVLFSIPIIGAVGCFLGPIAGVLTFVIWAGLIILAFIGKDFQVPVIGKFAARVSGLHKPM